MMVKMLALALMPIASASTAAPVKPGVRLQRPQRVGEVLPQHRGVLPWRRGQQVVHGLEPETRQRADRAVAPSALALRSKHLFHLAAVFVAEIEWQDAQQRPEDPAAHRTRVAGVAAMRLRSLRPQILRPGHLNNGFEPGHARPARRSARAASAGNSGAARRPATDPGGRRFRR